MTKKRESLTECAYRKIKQMIVNGQLSPGMEIKNQQMQDMLGLGRTPVHEALIRLQQEKLVEVIPRKGVRISRLSLKSIHDIFELRIMLEPAILHKYGDRIEHSWLIEMEKDLRELISGKEDLLDRDITHKDILRSNELDGQLHAKIAEVSQNAAAVKVLEEFGEQMELVRNISTANSRRFYACNTEHLAILKALLDHDIDHACEQLVRHLKVSYEDIVLSGIDDRW